MNYDQGSIRGPRASVTLRDHCIENGEGSEKGDLCVQTGQKTLDRQGLRIRETGTSSMGSREDNRGDTVTVATGLGETR